MDTLSRHYHQLVGLNSDWVIASVDLDVMNRTLTLALEFVGARVVCPECGAECAKKDHAAERSWRHLDAMQFQTTLTARIPRCSCEKCGVKTISVPWAEKHSRFTLLFEAFAIDEKSFGKGHNYVSVMTDIDQSRVLEVTPDRTRESADELWKTLSEEQRRKVTAVCMGMWQAYEARTEENVPNARIVHDHFHIAKYLNEAVDKVRRAEHRQLQREGDDRLKDLRQTLLFNPENLSDDKNEQLEALRKSTLATGRAWSLKELFRYFWQETDAVGGRAFFESWYAWAIRSRLDPIKKVARMLKTRIDRILTWFSSPISNGPAEGFNSRIQAIKSAARGFRIFEQYRVWVLFFCGDLSLNPAGISQENPRRRPKGRSERAVPTAT